MWKSEDRQEIEKLPCAFCGQTSCVTFSQSGGYESHFADSDFNCILCGCSYPVGLFFGKTIDDCKELLLRRARGYYDELVNEAKEKSEILERYKKKIQMYENNFNPSKREKLGK